jgi:hypothetical protein
MFKDAKNGKSSSDATWPEERLARQVWSCEWGRQTRQVAGL